MLLMAGTGALTVRSSHSLSSSDQLLTVTADDVHVGYEASVSSGAGAMVFTAHTAGREIGVGAVLKPFRISDDELALLSSSKGLTIGDSSNGPITALNVSNAGSAALASVALVALAPGRSINVTNCKFSGALQVHASNHVQLAEELTSNGISVIDAGTGSLTVVAGGLMSTTGHSLTITADDVDLAGSLNCGLAALTLMPQSHREMELGGACTSVTSGKLCLSSAEISRIKAGGFTAGARFMNKGITVHGLDTAATEGITGTVTLVALTDDSEVTFDLQPSTFHSLAVVADNGVTVRVDLTASTGSLYLDGDADNSATSDDVNVIAFTDGVTLTANEFLTLEASGTPPPESLTGEPLSTSTGMIIGSGSLTLQAGAGVAILDHLQLGCTLAPSNSTSNSSNMKVLPAVLSTGKAPWALHRLQCAANQNFANHADIPRLAQAAHGTGKDLVINSDMHGLAAGLYIHRFNQSVHGYGGGVLTVATDKLVATTDSNMMITAYDIDLQCTGLGCGAVSSGTAAISIHASRTGQSIGLGTLSDMSISDAELLQLHVGGASSIGELTFRRFGDVNCTEDSAPDVTPPVRTTFSGSELPKPSPEGILNGLRFGEPIIAPVQEDNMESTRTYELSRLLGEARSGWHCGSITVHEVSRSHTVQPDIVAFGRHFLSHPDYSTAPAVSSKILNAQQQQLHTQVYEVSNDFLEEVPGTALLQVSDIVNLGDLIRVTWYSDTSSDRLSHELDWIALYRRGECREDTGESTEIPASDLDVARPNTLHQCYIAKVYVQPHRRSGTVTFSYIGPKYHDTAQHDSDSHFGFHHDHLDSTFHSDIHAHDPSSGYHSAGEYELRYFYGDSRDGGGYKCGLQPGSMQPGFYCALRPKAFSSVISVVKSGPAESMEGIPGMETYADPEDGAMYAGGF